MRAASFICSIKTDQASHLLRAALEKIKFTSFDVGDIEMMLSVEIQEAARVIGIGQGLLSSARQACVVATMHAKPHTDDVPGKYTIGLVLHGNHTLFTGNGRSVCHLTTGDVYWINNTKTHGAKPNSIHSPMLIILAIDYDAYSDKEALEMAIENK